MPAVPLGTVTFLFTDIEGSTKLWEDFPDEMRNALARHDCLLKEAIEQNNGYTVKTTGDGVMAAFHTAVDALNATLTAQQAFLHEAWPQPVAIKVRMGIYTGAAEFRDGDYYGPTLNRAARLMAAGHGGQVLLSLATVELCRDTLPPPASLQLLGERRLKDLNRPETIYQLIHPDLPAAFPPLKTLDLLPNNLPQQLTTFIGREKEIKQVKELFQKTRLLTLTGAGGNGKTRLSLQIAADLVDAFPDGVWFVELAPLADPGLVPQTVAQVLGIREQVGKTIVQALLDHLKPRHLLLVLDNCEHVLGACAALADTLLRTCPHIAILTSSREALRIAGEQTYRVPSLSLPNRVQNVTLESVSQFEAVRLFVERATGNRADFAVTNANAPALASICHRLDGIPLAIELAAARIRSLSVDEIHTRLDNRFRLLTGGNRAALPRQQTLRALVDWSYDLLTEQERMLLARLSVFAGGWSLSAAEAVCGFEPIDEFDVLDLLTSLVDKSLVLADTDTEGNSRYRILETIREYAAEQMTGQERQALAKNHRGFFRALAEEAEPQIAGPQQSIWLDRLEREHDNFREALASCGSLSDKEGAEANLGLVCALWRFWWVRGHLSEGRRHLEKALQWEEAKARTEMRAKALHGAGTLAHRQGEIGVAYSLFEESLAIRREVGDKRGIAESLQGLSSLARLQSNYRRAQALQEECLTIYQEMGDRSGVAGALTGLGYLAWAQGDETRARALFEENLAVQREREDRRGIAHSLCILGDFAMSQSDYAAARPLFQESMLLYQNMGDRVGIAWPLHLLGMMALLEDDYTQARSFYEDSLMIYREVGDSIGIAWSLVYLAMVTEDPASAWQLFTESLTLCKQMGDKRGVTQNLEGMARWQMKRGNEAGAVRLWSMVQALRSSNAIVLPLKEQEKLDGQVMQARRSLDEAAFASAWAEGQAMTIEEAIEAAMERRR